MKVSFTSVVCGLKSPVQIFVCVYLSGAKYLKGVI